MRPVSRDREQAQPGLVIDDLRVHDLLGEDPLVLVVPAHHGGVPERDIVHVEQDFVLALAVPDLAAGVTAKASIQTGRVQRGNQGGSPGQLPGGTLAGMVAYASNRGLG